MASTTTIPIDTPLERQSTSGGFCYVLEFTVSNYTAGTVTVKIGSTEGTALTINSVNADGTYSQGFDYALSQSEDFDNIYVIDTGVNDSDITGLSIKSAEACASELCSEQFELDTCDLPNRPLMKLRWTNNEDGLGFAYSFIPLIHTMYVKGALRIDTGVYDSEDYYTDSKGTRSPIYVDAKKRQEMWVHQCPAYVHDALRVGLVHDTFTIDGVAFTKAEGGYDPDWDVPNSLLAPVSVGVRKADQDTINDNC